MREKIKKMLAYIKNICYIYIRCEGYQTVNIIRLRGQAVKTLASHAGIRGSIPLGVTERIPGSAWKSSASGFFHVYVPENGGTKGANYKIFISWI
jgi:hypothetical protein